MGEPGYCANQVRPAAETNPELEALREFAQWVVALDDVALTQRRTITLAEIVERARKALET